MYRCQRLRLHLLKVVSKTDSPWFWAATTSSFCISCLIKKKQGIKASGGITASNANLVFLIFKYQGGTASIWSNQKPPPTASIVPNIKSVLPHSSSQIKPIIIKKGKGKKLIYKEKSERLRHDYVTLYMHQFHALKTASLMTKIFLEHGNCQAGGFWWQSPPFLRPHFYFGVIVIIPFPI